MGWIALLMLTLSAGALAWGLGVPASLRAVVAAALMLGAAGYALQGRPAQRGHPVTPDDGPMQPDDGTIELRDAMLGRFSLDHAYTVASDALMRANDADSAVTYLLAGLRKLPQSMALWTALGTAIARHDGDTVSPAALLSFEQAARLSPLHPAPPFFLGLAYVRAGRFAEARPLWAHALALTPPGVAYRQGIAERLALLDRLLAIQAGRAPPPR